MNNSIKEKKKNNGIDLLKGIACLLVIVLHSDNNSNINNSILELCRCAVPIFLLISGYFSFNSNYKVIKKRLFKIMKITVFTFFIYFIWNILLYHINGEVYIYAFVKEISNIKSIVYLILFNRAPIITSIFYYLLIMIYLYSLELIAIKFNLINKKSYYLIPILLLVGIVIQQFGFPWFVVGNFIFTGIPFYLTGKYIASKKAIKNNITIYLVSIIIGITISIIYSAIIKDYDYYDIGTIMISIGLFLFALKRNIGFNIFVYIGRYLSLYIFLFHKIIIDINEIFIENALLSLPVTIIETILLCFIIYQITRRIQNET